MAGPKLGVDRGSPVQGPRSTHPHQPGRLGEPTEPTPAVTADAARRIDPGPCFPSRWQGARLGGQGWRRPFWDGHRTRRSAPGTRGRSSVARLERRPIRPGGRRAMLGRSDDRGRAADLGPTRCLASTPNGQKEIRDIHSYKNKTRSKRRGRAAQHHTTTGVPRGEDTTTLTHPRSPAQTAVFRRRRSLSTLLNLTPPSSPT